MGPGEYEVGFWLIVRLSVLIAGLAIEDTMKESFEKNNFFWKKELPVRERVVDGGGGSELRSRYTGGVKPVI